MNQKHKPDGATRRQTLKPDDPRYQKRMPSEKSLANLKAHAGGGRVKGVPNKTTVLLKNAILDAANIAGDNLADRNGSDYRGVVAYCAFLAEEHPQAFTSLLGKVLPMQITGADGGAIQIEQRMKEDADAVSSAIAGLVERARTPTVVEHIKH